MPFQISMQKILRSAQDDTDTLVVLSEAASKDPFHILFDNSIRRAGTVCAKRDRPSPCVFYCSRVYREDTHAVPPRQLILSQPPPRLSTEVSFR